jgi:hypothetical protein
MVWAAAKCDVPLREGPEVNSALYRRFVADGAAVTWH